ncbi:MAG: SpoIID/LytB domain-containing protein [Clostridia bacterium]|jgi:stage II sporulation protein D|nr:SpoIID/LytB domain-containing protein [Clostridia bacterium]
MRYRVKSNRFYFIVAFLVLILLSVLFWPRKIEHAILIESDGKRSTFFVGDKRVKYKTGNIDFEKFSVINFKRNIFKCYGFTKVDPMQERVMSKAEDQYDLEISGPKSLNKEAHYYQIDPKGNINYSAPSKLIVGKNNVRIYKNKKDQLTTFIMTPVDYSTIRVGISTTDFKDLYHKNIDINAKSSLKVYSKRENYSTSIPENTALHIEFVDKKIKLTINGLSREFSNRLYIEGEGLELASVKRKSDNSMIPVYNGVLEITPASDKSALLMINEVNLENYLAKVVPSEMPASSALEALKAQSIAARTYAISDMLANRFAKHGFHVDDSQNSQVYNNIEEQTRATEAVNATKGLIATYKGSPIDAKYYSTSAGTGANYGEIYFKADGSSDNKPYLSYSSYISGTFTMPSSEEEWLDFYKRKDIVAVDSSYDLFRWKVTYPTEALTKNLNKTLKNTHSRKKDFMTIKVDKKEVDSLPELKNLKDIKVLKRGEAGNVVTINFIFENAEVQLSGDGNIRPSIKCSEEYGEETITLYDSKNKARPNFGSLPSSFFAVEKEENAFIIYGGGFGHGVGMSQYGAIEMGKKGEKYDTILNTFYKGIDIETIY